MQKAGWGSQFPGVLGSATSLAWGFPGDSDGKESACQSRIQVQPLGQEDSPGVGNGNPLQYSCLENPMDRGARQATVHEVMEESDTTERLNNNNLTKLF